MQRYVIRENIERFKALLKRESDEHQRALLSELLAAEEEKLIALGASEARAPAARTEPAAKPAEAPPSSGQGSATRDPS